MNDTILLVSGSRPHASSLQSVLQRRGYPCDHVATTADALRRVSEVP
ncbi:MAG: response regulator transcription factor, partial [Myxococcales bacterium]